MKITLVKSTIGAIPKHRKTIKALGLKTLNQEKIYPDNSAMRGMIFTVSHLIKVEEIKE